MIRQPIVTVAGHVDHGKTSILDKLRETAVAEGEAGGITQKISFTLFPAENIKKGCYLLDKYNYVLEIPGFLFIDTPGHAAFTNLRKRGGSLADLAILVVDINEGIKPQTAEVLQILKNNKIPFIVALNKIDVISGWRKQDEDLRQSIEKQAEHAKRDFKEKLYKFMAALSSYKFESELYYDVKDFTKKVALVPVSAETGEGLPELLMVLCGVSQRFLKGKLNLGEKAKGVVLEVKKEKNQNYVEAILYDGELEQGNEIAVASFDEAVIAKIRVLEEIKPLSHTFKNVSKARAATGLRLQLVTKKEILPGMPFEILEDNLAEIEKKFKKEIEKSIQTDEKGIVVKADSLGSLEALITLLKEKNIKIVKAGIGNISKSDIIAGKTNLEVDEENAVIVGFNVGIDEEAEQIKGNVKILNDDVIYKLIEDLLEWQENKRKEIQKRRLSELAVVCKLEILHEYVFHNSNPAIFGVKILGGKINKNIELVKKSGEVVGRIKNIQSENKSVDEAAQGQEVAISITGVNFERQLKEEKILYSNLTSKQFKTFKENKDLLNSEEKAVLSQIAEIKRKEDIGWGV